MRLRRPTLELLRPLALGALLAACASPLPSDPPASSSTIPTIATSAPSPSFSADEIADWVAFREAYGLRADEEWVRQVATDRASANDTGIPLLPFELDALGQAVTSLNGLIDALQRYGSTIPSVFAGVVADGHDAVLLVADDPATHRAVLAAILPSLERIQIRSVRRTLADLDVKAAAIEARPEALEAIGAELIDASVNMTANVVSVHYIGHGPELDPAVRSALGGGDWILPRWQGPLPWSGSRGHLMIRAVDDRGRAVVGASCAAHPVDPAVNADDAIAYGTNDQGECLIQNYPAARYIVTVTLEFADGTKVEAKRRAVIPAGGTGEVEVVFGP